MSRPFRSNDRSSTNEIAWNDLFAKYDELLRLRQQVKIAECGRAIGPLGLNISARDKLHATEMKLGLATH